MKILVLSLLRLGDIIQQGPLLKGLRKQFPDAEIHLLMNRQFANVDEVLQGAVDKYVYFDRESLQKALGEPAQNILGPYRQLTELTKQLKSESYNVAFNFTHNKLSAYLLGALDIADIRGLHHDGQFRGLDNRWLKYFNDRFSGTQKTLFHYVELLGHAFSIPVQKTDKPAIKRKSKIILFQPLTSDVKKNWGLARFKELKELIEKSLVDYKIKILGAAFEKAELEKYFAPEELVICSLAEVTEKLQDAALLVTGDTSIKHLAAQLGTPLVEIALGGSDPEKTAAFSEASVILKSKEPCAPCVHSQACSQKTHACAETMSVDAVFAAVWDQLVGEKAKTENILRLLEKTAVGIYLDNTSEAGAFAKALREVLQKTSTQEVQGVMKAWMARSESYQAWITKARVSLPSRDELAAKRQFQAKDISDLILLAQDILKSGQDEAGYFQVLIEALLSRFTTPVQMHDRIKSALDEIGDLLRVREGLTQHLQILSMEGAYYAKGIGHLSDHGFAEAGTSLRRNTEDAGL